MIELKSQYGFNCMKCRQCNFLKPTSLIWGGNKQLFIKDLHDTFDVKTIESFSIIDTETKKLRSQGFYLLPIGHNLEIIEKSKFCEYCNTENSVLFYLNKKQIYDAGIWVCSVCKKNSCVNYKLMEERLTHQYKEKTINFMKGIEEGKIAIIAILPRIVVCDNAVVILDRLSKIPNSVTCNYCGFVENTKLIELEHL